MIPRFPLQSLFDTFVAPVIIQQFTSDGCRNPRSPPCKVPDFNNLNVLKAAAKSKPIGFHESVYSRFSVAHAHWSKDGGLLMCAPLEG
jgi:hypothetical protein